MQAWDACDSAVDAEELKGRVCYGGLDLSATTDVTAFVLVFPPIEENEPYKVLPFFWVPEETLAQRVKRDHVPYDVWEKRGHVKTTEGNVIDYAFVEKFILDLSEVYNIREIAYDPWNGENTRQRLETQGALTMVQFRQGMPSFNSPTKELLRIVLENKLAHGGQPALRWMVDNVCVKTDESGNIRPDKEKSTERIDGAVALIMALDRALKGGGGSGKVYDGRDLLLI